MPLKPIGLFNSWTTEATAYKGHPEHMNHVLAYCASRFRSALPVLMQHQDDGDDDTVHWMQDAFFMELV